MNDTITAVTPVSNPVDDLPQKSLCGLSKNQFNRFRSAFNATYGAIADDIGSCSRSEMIELVCDADRILTFGDSYRGYSKNKAPSDFPEFYKTVINPMLNEFYGTPVFKKMMKQV